MLPRLGEVLYWAACWIAVTVAMLAAAAWLSGGGESWIGVRTFFFVAGAIWLVGRIALLFSPEPRIPVRKR